jgi:hypothetical protein
MAFLLFIIEEGEATTQTEVLPGSDIRSCGPMPKIAYAHQERDGDKATKLVTPWRGRAGNPMTIFTDRELEFIAGLRTNWERLYLREIARLLNGANNNVLRSSGTNGANVLRL